MIPDTPSSAASGIGEYELASASVPKSAGGVRQEVATVYRGGGRRFFTRRAAERAEAKAIIRKRCECERGDILNGDYGYTCRYHSDRDRYERAVRLLLAMFIRKEARS